MSAPDYNVDAGLSPCCAYCDVRRNCRSTVKNCSTLAEFAQMREFAAALAAVIGRFGSVYGRGALIDSVADWFGDCYSNWLDEREFSDACNPGGKVPA